MSVLVCCPHCDGDVELNVKDMNCRIFRHGNRKDNDKQLPPHASQQECENLLNPIFGCGKPFKVIEDTNTHKFTTVKTSYDS